MILSLGEYLAMSGDISGGPRCAGRWGREDAAQHPTMHRADTTAPLRPTTKNLPGPK